MIKKILLLNILLFFIFINKLYANLDNNIVVKIDNEIITKFEIKNKILSTLILSKQKINQKNIDDLKRQTLESLIELKLKKLEVSKYDIKIDNLQLDQYLNSVSSNNISSMKEKFDDNGLDYDLFLEELQIGFKWQQFIVSTYSKRININSSQIENELKDLIKSDEGLKEYNLSEIEISINENKEIEEKIEYIKQQIKTLGFDQTAFNYSISSSSDLKGNIGWVNSKSLSKDIFEILKEMETGQVSIPIINKNNILFLKINDKRIRKLDSASISKLKNDIINEKKNELFNLYSKNHILKLKNNSFIEYR